MDTQARLAALDRYGVGMPAAPKKKGNLFTSLLPTIGGVAGGALGSIFAPGAGTAAGGAGGAMLGKKLANMLTGEDDKLQDYLVEGAFGTIGGIGKAAKGIKGAGAALKGGQGVRQAGRALRYGDSLQDTIKIAQGGAASLGDDVVRGVGGLTSSGRGAPSVDDFFAMKKNINSNMTKLDDLVKEGDRQARNVGKQSKLIKQGSADNASLGDITEAFDYRTATPNKGTLLGNPLERMGRQAQGNAWGVKTGAKVNGNALNPKEVANLQKYGKDVMGIPKTADSEIAAEIATTFNDEAGKAVGSVIQKHGAARVNPKEIDTILGGVKKETRFNVANLLPDENKMVQQIEKNVNSLKNMTLKDAHEFKGSLDDIINYRRADGSAVPGMQKYAKEMRTKLNGYLEKAMPGYGDANKAYSNSKQILDLTTGASGKTKDILNIPGTGTAMQRIQGTVGRGMESVGGQISGNSSGMLNKVIGDPNTFKRAAFNVGKTQVPARMMLGGMGGGEEPPVDETGMGVDMYGGDLQSQLAMAGGMEMPQEPQSQYPIENFLSDVQRDPQNMKEYQQLFAMINPNYGKEPKKSQAFGRPSAQLYSQAKTGMASVDKLMNMISGNSGLVNAAAIPGQSLPIVGGLISKAAGTNEYKAAASNILNSIARINTGAAMPPSEEAFYARTYLPQPGDDEATIQAKVQNLYQFFNPIANYEAESSGGGGGDQIMDALALGGYQ